MHIYFDHPRVGDRSVHSEQFLVLIDFTNPTLNPFNIYNPFNSIVSVNSRIPTISTTRTYIYTVSNTCFFLPYIYVYLSRPSSGLLLVEWSIFGFVREQSQSRYTCLSKLSKRGRKRKRNAMFMYILLAKKRKWEYV